jgi:hypothetical protein
MGTTFSAINAVQIYNLHKDNIVNNKKMATLSHISQIQEEHIKHLEIENDSQNQITLNELRFNPAILASAAHQVVIQSSDTIHKVKSTMLQAQNHELSTDFLRGDTIEKA